MALVVVGVVLAFSWTFNLATGVAGLVPRLTRTPGRNVSPVMVDVVVLPFVPVLALLAGPGVVRAGILTGGAIGLTIVALAVNRLQPAYVAMTPTAHVAEARTLPVISISMLTPTALSAARVDGQAASVPSRRTSAP